MTFENIRLVARYERNLIIRNKLFWIFACCVVAGISFSHWLWQSDSLGGLRWLNRALPSFIPFWNAWFRMAGSAFRDECRVFSPSGY